MADSKKVPEFKSIEEERKFWDEHDATDHLVAPLRRRNPRRLTPFSIKLDEQTLVQIRELAARQEMGPTQLVREWILDRLKVELGDHGLEDGRTNEMRQQVIAYYMETLPAAVDKALQSVFEQADVESQFLTEDSEEAVG